MPRVSGGFVVEEPATGRVLAMQGGFDARIQAFNRATQALRQPGSTIKPLVYASALENGMTPASIIVDGPFCVYQGARLGNKCFRNFANMASAGPQTMRWGIEQSRNLMTVRTAATIGMTHVVDTIKRMGVGDYAPYLAFALGAGDTTVLRMVNAYATLENQGRAHNADDHRLRPGSPRQGDPARQLAPLRRLQRARLDRRARCRGRRRGSSR